MSFELSSLATSVSLLGTLARALIDERDRQKAATLQADLTKQVIDVQAQLSQVLTASIAQNAALHAASERVRELEAAQAEKARYRLAKVGSLGTFHAYELRPASELVERTDEPPHFLCQPCFDAGKKGVLNISGHHARCGVCGRATQIEPLPPPAPRRSVDADDYFRRRDW